MSWSRVSLADISESVDYGHTASADTNIVGPKFLRITDIQDNHVDWASVPRCACSKSGAGKFALQEGDIVFARTGATTGKSYLLRQIPEVAVFASYLIRVRPRQVDVDPGYLARFFETQDYWGQINQNSSGTAQGGVNASKLKKLSVPLPPLPEQRRIAAILDKADALRAKRREAIAKLDQLLQSVFLQMFGDPVTNPKGWNLTSLTSIGEWKSGATPSKSEPAYWDGTFPWVSPKDMKVSVISDAQDHVSERAFKETNLKRIDPGHLLIVVRGMILAHSFPTAVNTVPIAINQDMKAIKPIKELDIVYLKAAVDSLKARILSIVSTAGHGTRRLDTRDASEVMVPVPPIELQLAYKSLANKNSQMRGKALEQLQRLDSMFWAVQQKAFEGTL